MISIRKAVFAGASLLAILAAVPTIATAEDQPSGAANDDTGKGKKKSERQERREERREQRQQKLQGEKPSGEFGKKEGGSQNPKVGGPPDNGQSGSGKRRQTLDNKAVDDGGKNSTTPDAFSKKRKFGDQDNDRSNNKFGNQDNGKPDNKLDAGDKNQPEFKKQFGKDNDRNPNTKPLVINPVQTNKGAAAGSASQDSVLSERDGRKRFENMKSARRERSIDGGKGIMIEEPGKRTIFKENNRLVIQHDETVRLRRVNPNARFEKGKSGTTISIIDRPGNMKIYSETDANGHLLRRYRRGPDGREVIIIDNRRRHRGGGIGKGLATGIGIGIGVAAGAAILDAMIDVPEPRVRIPREKYIVDYDRASDEDVYEALSAPPIEEYDDRYSLDEIRATARLRDRMRRIDLDDINFEFGSWEVDPGQYGKLERIARAMRRVIDRNPNEVFLIEGYTDAVGTPEDNLSLSDRRAESVAEVLSEQFNIPFENLTTQGYGEEYLKVPTDGPERLNRRVAMRRITPLLARDNGPPAAARSDYGRSDARDGSGPDDSADRERDGPNDADAPDGPNDRDQGDPDQGGRGDYQYSPYQGDQRN